ncbi:MAG: response regulator, partial [Thermodesulfobacteriota bacterium]
MKQEQASILVIDDELIVRRLVQSVLEGEGYRVFSASSGMQGLKTARQFQPDLVLLDIVLPDMDGYEVWRMIKESNDLSATPVIFITAREETRIHSENARMGYVVDYIPKPIISEILLARVRNLLELVQSRKVLLWKNRELERKVADRNRLTAVIEQSGRAVLIVDHEDIVVYVNPAFGRVTGYPDNEVLGQPIESVERPVLTDYGYRELLPLI